MSMGAIGAAVAGAVVTKAMSNRSSRASTAGASAADPFAGQRGYYQDLLLSIYGQATGDIQNVGTGQYDTAAYEQALQAWQSSQQATGWQGDSENVATMHPHSAPKPSIEDYKITAPPSTGTTTPATSYIENLPGYQFNLDQGIKSLSRSAAAKGMLQSGNYMQDLLKYSQGLASQTYTSEMNRLMTLSGATVGSPATAGQLTAQAGQQSASGTQNAVGQLGYGLAQALQPQTYTTQQAIGQQTGYQGGAEGVLSGAEFASWN
jgi:hypothetical protein